TQQPRTKAPSAPAAVPRLSSSPLSALLSRSGVQHPHPSPLSQICEHGLSSCAEERATELVRGPWLCGSADQNADGVEAQAAPHSGASARCLHARSGASPLGEQLVHPVSVGCSPKIWAQERRESGSAPPSRRCALLRCSTHLLPPALQAIHPLRSRRTQSDMSGLFVWILETNIITIDFICALVWKDARQGSLLMEPNTCEPSTCACCMAWLYL
ncbi:hypothetical protein EJB05_37319, partial [Eragrostis curvula]